MWSVDSERSRTRKFLPAHGLKPGPFGGHLPARVHLRWREPLPRLQWSTPPPGTQELAIEMLDPDAPGGTFTHWLACGLRPGISGLAAAPARRGRRRQGLRRPR